MSAIRAIARNTFREAIRDRVLYLILFFAALVIVGSELVAVLAFNSVEKVVLDLGLAAIAFFGILASVFLGLSLVSKEIERRTIYTVVSKPISRASFVLGKLAGLYLTVVLMVAAMSAVFLAFVRLRHGISDLGLLRPIALSLVEDLLVASFALLFSCFTTPILGTLFSMTVYVIGHLSVGLKMLAERPEVAETAGRKVLLGLYFVLPNLERFNLRDAAVHGVAVAGSEVLAAVAYGLCYSAAVVGLAIVVLSRRDFV